MAVNLSPLLGAGWQVFNDDGIPLAGGKIYTYQAGTTIPATTYTTSAGNIQHSNPILLDAAGRVNEVWITEGQTYKFVIKASDDTLIGTYDNLTGINDVSNIFAVFANTADVAKGDALIGFRQSNSSGLLPNSQGKTVHDKLQESLSVKDFGAVGDGVADDTAAIQNAINYIRDLYVTTPVTTPLAYRKLVFPQGVYKITNRILLPFASASGNSIPRSGSTEIVGYGAIIVGSGSASDDHDCFVSAYYNGSTNLPTLGTPGESTLTYSVQIKGFTINNVRRAFELQNWNVQCKVSDINCWNVQSAVYARRCFFAQFENINSSGAPDEMGSTIVVASASGFSAGNTVTGATSGDTATIQRVDGTTLYVSDVTGGFSTGETINSSGGGSSTVFSFEPVGNFDVRGFVNIQPLKSCVGGSHDINICISGADGSTLYDCNAEGSQIGIFIAGECNMLTIVDAYIEGNTSCGIYVQGIPRQFNLIGCFINQGAVKLIKSNLAAAAYAVVNFNNCRLFSGDFTLPANFYGNYYGDGIAAYPLSGSKTINMSPQPLVNLASGYTGPTRIVDWDHSTSKNPGFYQSTFGDATGGLSSNHPFQTLTTGSGSVSGTKYTFDTEIDADFNLIATWYMRWADATTVRTRNFLIIAETANGGGTATTFRMFVRDSATDLFTEVAVADPDFSATQSGGKLQLIADNLDGPALAASIVRVI